MAAARSGTPDLVGRRDKPEKKERGGKRRTNDPEAREIVTRNERD